MNRRRFLELLGMASVGGAVASSFPEVVVPQNIVKSTTGKLFAYNDKLILKVSDNPTYEFGFSGFREEIYQEMGEDIFFIQPSLISYKTETKEFRIEVQKSVARIKNCTIP